MKKLVFSALFFATALWMLNTFRISSSQDQILGGDEYVIDISRRKYLIPREFHSAGEMNPFLFLKFAQDPTFESNKLMTHNFTNENGEKEIAAVQGFHINRFFRNPKFKEDVLAIRTPDGVFEYKVPDLRFVPFSNFSFLFLGQSDQTLYYYFATARDAQGFTDAIIQIELPFEGLSMDITQDENGEKWAILIEKIRGLFPSEKTRQQICSFDLPASSSFAEIVFDKSCS